MRITSAGNVGINCTPSYKLQWSDGTRTGLLDTNIGAVVIGSVSNDALAFYTNLTEKMRILGNGNVGIGFTTPSVKLDVRLSGTTGRVAEFHNSVGYGIGFTVQSDGGVNTISSESNQALAFATNGASERMRITIGGNVQARRPRSNTAGDVALSLQPTDTTAHYGWRIDQATNSLNLDYVNTPLNLVSYSTTGNATFAGTSNSNVVIARDNMFVVGGQFYIGADNGATDNTFRQAVASGAYKIESRESGTWTQRFMIDTNGAATFSGDVLAPRYNIDTDNMSIISESNRMKFTNAIANDAGGFDFYTRNTGSTYINALQILGTGNSTFAGDVGVGMAPDSAVALSVSGQIGTTNGTAAAPTHTFYSDDDTGMFRAGANNLGFSTGGTERMRITPAGQVQIGYYNTARGGANTTFMTGKSGTTYLEINGGDTSGEGGILFADGSSGNYGLINYSHVSDIMQFYTTSGERMRITDTLITFPTVTELRGDIGSNKFAVGNMGDSSSQMMVSSRGFLTFNVSNTGSAKDATERMRIDSSGIIRIYSPSGTSEKTYSAAAGLELYSQQSDSGSPYTKTSDIVANGDGTVPSELRMFTKADGSSTPTERMRINSDGISNFTNDGTTASKQKSVLRLGGGGAANGYTLINDTYTATESQLNIGLGYSGSPVVISQNCKVSATVDDQYLSSNAQGNTRPQAFILDAGDFVFKNTQTSATRAVDSVVALDEILRLADDGQLWYGTNGNLTTTYPTSNNFIVMNQKSGVNMIIGGHSGTHTVMQFRHNGATAVGSITIDGTSTTYNTSSDYRLKEDLKDFAGLDMVSKIPVYDFKWKTDDNRSYGVMAHELQEVLPQAVSGDKDAKEMQGVDYSKIVPLLVKSIQELKAEIEILKNK